MWRWWINNKSVSWKLFWPEPYWKCFWKCSQTFVETTFPLALSSSFPKRRTKPTRNAPRLAALSHFEEFFKDKNFNVFLENLQSRFSHVRLKQRNIKIYLRNHLITFFLLVNPCNVTVWSRELLTLLLFYLVVFTS